MLIMAGQIVCATLLVLSLALHGTSHRQPYVFMFVMAGQIVFATLHYLFVMAGHIACHMCPLSILIARHVHSILQVSLPVMCTMAGHITYYVY
jgi:hypothetical protein